jgi:SsrA-binding protein
MPKAISQKPGDRGDRTVATNRRARHDYDIEETLEAGIVLVGTEVKSLRNGALAISDAYGTCKDGNVEVVGMKIEPYSHGNIRNHAPSRTRRLLLKTREIKRLAIKVQQGMQVVILRVYFSGGRAKVEVGLGKPKRAYDKRQAIKARDEARDARNQGD